MPVILATEEAEIRRIVVQSQPQVNSSGDLILKNPITKKRRRKCRAGEVAQVVRVPVSKCKTLSSNFSAKKKKKKQKKKPKNSTNKKKKNPKPRSLSKSGPWS
jgi:hypothetical protein